MTPETKGQPWRTVVQYRRGVICPADCGYYAQEIVTEGSDEGTIICTNCGHTRSTVVDDAPHHDEIHEALAAAREES